MAKPSVSLCNPSAPHRRPRVHYVLSRCRCSVDRLDKQQFVSSYQVWVYPISTLKGSPEIFVGESVQDRGVHIIVRRCQVRCSVGRHNEQCWFWQAQPLGLLQPLQHLVSSASTMPLRHDYKSSFCQTACCLKACFAAARLLLCSPLCSSALNGSMHEQHCNFVQSMQWLNTQTPLYLWLCQLLPIT